MEFKNVSGDDLDLPALGLHVKAGDTVEVTGDDAKGLSPAAFERVDKPARKSESKES